MFTATHTNPPSLFLFHFQIDYFNNQIIVDLVEQQHKGILSILDEACLTVGKVTDTVCLDSMDTKLAQHPHYTSRKVGLFPAQLPHGQKTVTVQVRVFKDILDV